MWKPQVPFPETLPRAERCRAHRGSSSGFRSTYTGTGTPEAAHGVASPRLRVALLLLFGAAVLVLYCRVARARDARSAVSPR